MPSRRDLERHLEVVAGFKAPDATLEQYATPPQIAASLVHVAWLRDDLDRPVVDLGSGTGMLAIAAALRTDEVVLGLEVDTDAIATARENATAVGVSVDWICGDSHAPPLCFDEPITVIMNPPFGAQRGQRGADRPFLAAASELATVSYSIHNAESEAFIRSYVADLGGDVTDAYALELDLPAQFAFHDEGVATVDAEAYRIEWGD